MKARNAVLICAAVAVAAFYVGWRMGISDGAGGVREVEVVKRDTMVRFDTVRVEVAQPTSERKVRLDTVRVETVRRDTVFVADSVEVVLPVLQREYTDTLYRLWVSGYEPRLDSIEVYPRTVTISERVETVRQRSGGIFGGRLGLGLSAGYGYTGRGFGPFVGVGLTWSVITF